jgi:ABC-type branched-subunit amino acid transport system substrate-binding protein
MTMRMLRWMALALALGLVVSACGDDDDDSSAAPPASTTAAATGTSTGAATDTTATAPGTTAAVTTGDKTILGSGIPSGDACPHQPVTGVPGVTDTEIDIGGVVAITNQTEQPYGDAVDGVLAYIKGVNDAGGVCGRKLKYGETVDDQGSVSRNLLGARKLVEEDKVFAMLPMVSNSMGSGQYIADSGVPTFGWNINPEWSLGDNMFGEKGSFVCFAGFNAPSCPNEDVVWMASQLVKAKKVAIMVYGSAPSSKACGDAQELSFKQWGAEVGVELDFYDSSLAFGFTPEALGPTIDRIKADNVDMLFTCMDVAANLRILTAMQDAGLKTAMYWPNGYDQKYLDEFGDQIKNYVVTGSFFRPFEVAPSPGMKSYQATMQANKLPISEMTLTGWINADLLVTGIRAAAGTDGTFDQKKVVDAINGLTYSAGGILPEFPWKDFHKGPTGPINCYAYEKVDGASKKFIPVAPDVSKPWICFDGDPLKFTYKTFGEADTGLSTTGVQGTASTAPPSAAAQPDDPAKATADVQALVTAYLGAPDASSRIALIANGDSVAEYITKSFSGVAVEPVDTKVTFTGKDTADVAFGISLGGKVLQGITSTAYVVNVGGTWLWHPLAACDGVSQPTPHLGPDCYKNAMVP